jgi:hypothetical protein
VSGLTLLLPEKASQCRSASATVAEQVRWRRASWRGLIGSNTLSPIFRRAWAVCFRLLTSTGSPQSAIGVALSIGTIASMVSQVPAGALADIFG